MPAPIAGIVRAAYGDATGQIFLIGAAFAVVALLAVLFVKEVPLRTTVSLADEAEAAATTGAGAADVSEHLVMLRAGEAREERGIPAVRGLSGFRAGRGS